MDSHCQYWLMIFWIRLSQTMSRHQTSTSIDGDQRSIFHASSDSEATLLIDPTGFRRLAISHWLKHQEYAYVLQLGELGWTSNEKETRVPWFDTVQRAGCKQEWQADMSKCKCLLSTSSTGQGDLRMQARQSKIFHHGINIYPVQECLQDDLQ